MNAVEASIRFHGQLLPTIVAEKSVVVTTAYTQGCALAMRRKIESAWADSNFGQHRQHQAALTSKLAHV
jgi:hypothetical protein